MKIRLFVPFLSTLLAFSVCCFGAEKTITAKQPPAWDSANVTAAPGDTVIWKIQSGTHGVMFKDYDTVKDFFAVDPSSLSIAVQAPHPSTDQGTVTKSVPGTVLVKILIKPLPEGTASKAIPFYCTNNGHSAFMTGTLTIQAPAAPLSVPKATK